MAAMKIKVTRTFFDRYAAPCGKPERRKIRLAWEREMYRIIEDAGFIVIMQYGISHSPSLTFFVVFGCNDEDKDYYIKCGGGSEPLIDEIDNLQELTKKYAEIVFAKACEAAALAATALSNEFVAAAHEAIAKE